MTTPAPPPFAHEPDEGRNRLVIVASAVIIAVAIIVALVIVTRDDDAPPSTGSQVGATAAAGNLPPPAAAATEAPTPVDPGASVTVGPATELQVVSVSAPETHQCVSATAGAVDEVVMLQWTTAGAQSVSVSMGDLEVTPLQTGLPPNGSTDVPAPCAGDTRTYHVTALGADGATVTKSVVVAGV